MSRTQLETLGLTLQAHLQRTEMYPAQVRLLRAALDRITAGTYDHCVRCSGQIGMVRLTALPYASLCIPCQEDAFYYRGSRRRVGEGSANV